ncbi:Transthyretin-like family-containing protein [Aphelenchoides fujianensis]|nr:Transthyretin-like family-containing protein [Aphelenchoides fujianensis]
MFSLPLLLLAATVAVFSVPASAGIGWAQSAASSGQLFCNGKVEKGVKIKLFDHDHLDPDDKMGETVADAQGNFQVAGKTTSISTILPEVHIKFDCGHLLRKCYKYKIPSSYVTKGASPSKVFPAGRIELSSVKPNC